MSRRLHAKSATWLGALVLAYSPIFGELSGTVARAQVPQNTTVSYLYDANGNPTQITDPLGGLTNLTYDTLNRVTRSIQPQPGPNISRSQTDYVYDAADRVTKVTDPRTRVTEYKLNGFANLIELISPDTGTAASTYDAADNLLTRTDARGKTTTFSYDALNRLTREAYLTGVASTFEYDGGANGAAHEIGNLTKFADESGNTVFTFDVRGRLLSKVQQTITSPSSVTLSSSYTYGTDGSALGKTASFTYPSGNRINYSYDSAGRISGISLSPAKADGTPNAAVTIPLVGNVEYAPGGLVQSWEWGNHTTLQPSRVTRSFDLDGRVTSYPLGNAANGGVVRTLTYDAGSRITAMTHTGTVTAPSLDQALTYDNVGRLTRHATSNSTLGFAYDKSGNRTQLTIGAATYGNTISATSNRLLSVAGPLPARTNTFDGSGNVTSDGTVVFTYSDRGRLRRVVKQGIATEYLYNARGERVAKSGSNVTGGAKFFAYAESGELLGEYGADGSAIQETIYFDGSPIAVAIAGSIDPFYVYSDHISTPRVITRTSDNAIVWRWDTADPFGMAPAIESPNGEPAFVYNPRFPGQIFDSETNNYYNYYRDFDPQIGRYLQSDPIGLAGGINTYAYVDNNPAALVDPFGLVGTANRRPMPAWWIKWNTPHITMHCGSSAECAAGLPPSATEDRSTEEIEQGQCELVCGAMGPGNVLPSGIALKAVARWAAANAVTGFSCKQWCKPKKKDTCAN